MSSGSFLGSITLFEWFVVGLVLIVCAALISYAWSLGSPLDDDWKGPME